MVDNFLLKMISKFYKDKFMWLWKLLIRFFEDAATSQKSVISLCLSETKKRARYTKIPTQFVCIFFEQPLSNPIHNFHPISPFHAGVAVKSLSSFFALLEEEMEGSSCDDTN